jgi:hypothetical protein
LSGSLFARRGCELLPPQGSRRLRPRRASLRALEPPRHGLNRGSRPASSALRQTPTGATRRRTANTRRYSTGPRCEAIDPSGLLRAQLQRPGQRCSAEQRDELASPHDERAIAPILPLLHGVPPWINPRRNPTSELSIAVMSRCGAMGQEPAYRLQRRRSVTTRCGLLLALPGESLKGHEDQFRPPSLNDGCQLGKATFAGVGGKEEDA